MSSVSIIRQDNPKGPADKKLLWWRIQQERKDPEALILKEYLEKTSKLSQEEPEDTFYELAQDCCKRLGDITLDEFFHKLFIYSGRIEDDEKEFREKKYGKK